MGKEVKIGVAVIVVLLAVLGALVARRLMPSSRGEPATADSGASNAAEQAAAGTTFERGSEGRPLTTAMKPAVVELKEANPRDSAGAPPEPRQWTVASDSLAPSESAGGAVSPADSQTSAPSYMPRPSRAESSAVADRYANAYPPVEGPVMVADPYSAGSQADSPVSAQHAAPEGGLQLLDPMPSGGAARGGTGAAASSPSPTEARVPYSQLPSQAAPRSSWPPQTQSAPSGAYRVAIAGPPAPPAPQPEAAYSRDSYANRNRAGAEAWNSRSTNPADGAGAYRSAPVAGRYGAPGAMSRAGSVASAGAAAGPSIAAGGVSTDAYAPGSAGSLGGATYPRQSGSLPVAPAGLGRSLAAQTAARSGDRGDGTYEVQPNDSYWTISEKVYGTGAYFKALAEHNRARAAHEDRLAVGQIIATPDATALESQYPDLCPKPERVEAQRAQIQAAAAPRGYAFGRVYTVEEGDTLFSIARHELGKAARWVEIYELNRNVLGPDHDYLRPGLQLVLPDDNAAPGPVTQRLGPDVPYQR